jgi:hypothetical protein
VRTTYVPEGAVREFEQASVFLRHPQAGFAVFVGANNYLRQLVSLFCHLFPGRTLWMLFAATVNDARRLLAERPRFDQCNIAVFRAAKGLT